ncbi:hypothetical protein [Embleya sp. NPDC059237]|uniref:hypothetical protein n=1 Tax=Embleya sp. NPDC059237 TaxID=3346784 RepID=UPI0036A20A77
MSMSIAAQAAVVLGQDDFSPNLAFALVVLVALALLAFLAFSLIVGPARNRRSPRRNASTTNGESHSSAQGQPDARDQKWVIAGVVVGVLSVVSTVIIAVVQGG